MHTYALIFRVHITEKSRVRGNLNVKLVTRSIPMVPLRRTTSWCIIWPGKQMRHRVTFRGFEVFKTSNVLAGKGRYQDPDGGCVLGFALAAPNRLLVEYTSLHRLGSRTFRPAPGSSLFEGQTGCYLTSLSGPNSTGSLVTHYFESLVHYAAIVPRFFPDPSASTLSRLQRRLVHCWT